MTVHEPTSIARRPAGWIHVGVLALTALVLLPAAAAAQGAGGGGGGNWGAEETFDDLNTSSSASAVKLVFRIMIKIVLPFLGIFGIAYGAAQGISGKVGPALIAIGFGLTALLGPALIEKILGIKFENYM